MQYVGKKKMIARSRQHAHVTFCVGPAEKYPPGHGKYSCAVKSVQLVIENTEPVLLWIPSFYLASAYILYTGQENRNTQNISFDYNQDYEFL